MFIPAGAAISSTMSGHHSLPWMVVLALVVFLFWAAPVQGGPTDRVDILALEGPSGIQTAVDPSLVDRIYRDLDERLGDTSGSGRPRLSPPVSEQWTMPSMGSARLLVLMVDFSDAPHLENQTAADLESKVFGAGDSRLFPFDSLAEYYRRSSYGQLTITGDVVGWVRAPHSRAYYDALIAEYDRQYPGGGVVGASSALVRDVCMQLDGEIDFSRYDGNHDGAVDGIILKYAGEPFPAMPTIFHAYKCEIWPFDDCRYDGTAIRRYVLSFFSSRTWGIWYTHIYPLYEPEVDIHETAHLLGLQDFYDGNGGAGPKGATGGWEFMDAGYGDLSVFSKYLLGWIRPTIIDGDGQAIDLQPSSISRDAVLIMPNASSDSYAEFFMVQYIEPGQGNVPAWLPEYRDGSDYGPVPFNRTGLLIWHVDARLNAAGTNFASDNSNTEHKLLRLMEADGLEELETLTGYNAGYLDPDDLFGAGQRFGPATVPSSRNYRGTQTGVRVETIAQCVGSMRATFRVNLSVPAVAAVPLEATPPRDLDADEQFEDVNGNGRNDFADVVLFFNQIAWIAANEPVSAFDYNGNGRIDFEDVALLFDHL